MQPRLLMDEAVLDGRAAALPLAWLDGMTLHPYPPRRLADAAFADLAAADALLLRSVTRLDVPVRAQMSRLRAVATLSSGQDHIDPVALQAGPWGAAVAFSSGHGGNALAVADWVQWALQRLKGRLRGLRVVVVGVGAVGTAVAQRLQAAGAVPLLCDPPRAAAATLPAHGELDDWIATRPDAVTLHVPLTTAGQSPWPTADLLDRGRLERLAGAVVLQAARGGVMDEHAAASLRQAGVLTGLAVDTWVNEPHPYPAIRAAADLGTPHIAGHTVEGKADVAWRAVTQLRTALGLAPLPPLADLLPPQRDDADDPDHALDTAAAAWAAGGDFEALRHAHRRRQRSSTSSIDAAWR